MPGSSAAKRNNACSWLRQHMLFGIPGALCASIKQCSVEKRHNNQCVLFNEAGERWLFLQQRGPAREAGGGRARGGGCARAEDHRPQAPGGPASHLACASKSAFVLASFHDRSYNHTLCGTGGPWCTIIYCGQINSREAYYLVVASRARHLSTCKPPAWARAAAGVRRKRAVVCGDQPEGHRPDVPGPAGQGGDPGAAASQAQEHGAPGARLRRCGPWTCR